MYINIMIDLIERRDFPEQRIKIEGILKYHHKNCTKTETCECQKILKNEANKWSIYFHKVHKIDKKLCSFLIE